MEPSTGAGITTVLGDGRDAIIDPLTLAYHELRSPLSLIVTAARAALHESEDRTAKARWQVVLRAADRLLRTSEDVLSLALQDDPGRAARFSPARIVGSIVSDLRALNVPLQLTLFPQAAAAVAYGAPNRFEALVQSLLTNASDHAPAGTPIIVEVAALTDVIEMRIENSIASPRTHHGLGTGLYLCGRMATTLGAGLTAGADGGTFRTRVTMPLLPAGTRSAGRSRNARPLPVERDPLQPAPSSSAAG